MAKEPIRIQTHVPLAEAASLFRTSMRVSWFSENISGAGTTFEKPRGSAFDELDDDPAQFSVMAMLGGRGAEVQKSAVYMYAWDRGDHREIRLYVGRALAALGIKARMKMRKFVSALQAADPATRYSGL